MRASRVGLGTYMALLVMLPADAMAQDQKPEVPLPAPKPGVVSMDTGAIRAVIREHRDEVAVCFDKELPLLDISFTIGSNGEVTRVRAVHNGESYPSVESCMLERMETWSFPEPPGGNIIVVRYPVHTDPIP